MYPHRLLSLAVIGAALCAAPAIAQQNNANTNPPAANAPANTAPAAPAANNVPPAPGAAATNATTNMAPAMTPPTAATNQGPSGSLQKYDNEWRSSKVVGATVYNSKGESIGSIDDLLFDDAGKVDKAVISTGGGVLGIGSKLVAVPFDQLKFEPSVQNNNNGVLRQTEAPASAPNTTTAGAQPNGAPAAGAPANTAAANTPAPPRYSIVLPDATKDSLTKQPEFKYASTG